jgi:hypothetical protein
MENTSVLPAGYAELAHIDFQNDRKLAVFVNVLSLATAAVMIAAAAVCVPFRLLPDADDSTVNLIRPVTLLTGILLYTVLHELVHGAFMKHLSGRRADYGFTGLYPYAGSRAYFSKKDDIIISLAPVVILGTALAVLNFATSADWFWVVYLTQTVNISGAVGDGYVACRICGMPPDILVHDAGVSMTIYSRTQK